MVCVHYVQFFVTPRTVAHQALLSMGFPKARILDWVAISSSRDLPNPGDGTRVSCMSCIGWWVLYHCSTWEVHRHDIDYLYYG